MLQSNFAKERLIYLRTLDHDYLGYDIETNTRVEKKDLHVNEIWSKARLEKPERADRTVVDLMFNNKLDIHYSFVDIKSKIIVLVTPYHLHVMLHDEKQSKKLIFKVTLEKILTTLLLPDFRKKGNLLFNHTKLYAQ